MNTTKRANAFRNGLKGHRIKKSKTIREIQKRGKRIHHQWFTFIVSKHDAGAFQFALSVSKRIGNACKRNRVKRLIRETLRKGIDDRRKDIAVLVVAKPGIVGRTCRDLETAIHNALNRIPGPDDIEWHANSLKKHPLL